MAEHVRMDQAKELAKRAGFALHHYAGRYYDIVGERSGQIFRGTLDECAIWLVGFLRCARPPSLNARRNPWHGKKGTPAPHQVKDRVVGSIGDVNPIEYGGGFVFKGEHGYYVEYTPGEDGSEGTKLEVYGAFVPADVLTEYDWVDWKAVASSSGETLKELRAAATGKKALGRVYAMEMIAGHYGWNTLDDSPLTMTPRELGVRWRKALAQKNPVSTRKGKWSKAYKDSLPDSHFFIVDTAKRSSHSKGFSYPLSVRHLPYIDKSGKVSIDHLRNAISRAPQTTSVPVKVRKAAQAQARKLLAKIEGK